MRIGKIASSAVIQRTDNFKIAKFFFYKLKKSRNLFILTIPKISNLENSKIFLLENSKNLENKISKLLNFSFTN